MSRPTHVYIVASPRPRTGKTTLARALIEFHAGDGRHITAFDLDEMDATLAQFLPALTERAEIGDTHGQVALFERLIVADGTTKVVDVSAHAFDTFFRVMAEIDFAGEARRQSVAPVILFAANPDRIAVKSYANLVGRLPDVTLAPVFGDWMMREWNLRAQFPTTSALGLPLRIPMLSPRVRDTIDAKTFSFTEFRRGPWSRIPGLLKDELNSWLSRVHLQFREMELRLLLSQLSGSFRGQIEPPMASALQ